MAQNTAPIFTQIPNLGFGEINTSNNMIIIYLIIYNI